ncbi:SLC13 family permease [Sphingobium algorifonticola]|uniref:SLC13 family permease n=1 Tax=Sphingobium algorifonticola TaxID=2008318 RepID=A0A437J9U6_9SPHN|nr:SLC13 family permease [Sphingobium algorifonticola]RVT42072.1 SLC13 family permease [Sphingobium algorifonticola]
MPLPQILAFAILAAMMGLFLWGRLRYDLVAILALLASVVAGTVPVKDAFSGFSDDIVIIVASALVVSAAVERSGIVELLLGKLSSRVKRIRWQLMILVTSVTFLSALVKNIGALAMLIPAALKMAKKSDASPSVFLMPMAFGSLLGGLITLVGTSPNIIVSRVREDITGEPFGMFDYAPVGLGLAITGIVFLRFGYRLMPRDRRAAPTMGEALDITDYMTEAEVREDSPLVGLDAAAFRERTEDSVEISAILRGTTQAKIAIDTAQIEAGDLLVMKGDPDALEAAIARQGLTLAGQDRAAVTQTRSGDIGVIEAVISGESLLVGRSAQRLRLHSRYGVNLLALSRAGERRIEGLSETRLLAGDVIVLQGPLDLLPVQLRELGCLPLAERTMRLGSVRHGLTPVAILGGAMALTAMGLVPVAMAFFGAAALMMLTGALPLRDAYDHVEWPILIMLGALIPVSEALQTTGGTDLIAGWLSSTAVVLPPWGAVALILVAAMAVTPFLNNAATVLVMAPIAATFASDIGLRPEAFLMAVAVGAGCDFLSPIGHQCNTLVMGPGGYRFGDYARLGAPLSLLVIIVGVPLIMLVWPV